MIARQSAPARPAKRFEAQGIETLEEVLRLRPEWDALYDLRAEAAPAVSWEWCYHWWRHYGAGHRVQVVTVRDPQGLLLGLAPLMQLPARWYQLREVRGLGDYRSSEIGSLDLLLRPGHEREALAALCEFLAQEPGWDRIRLARLPADSAGLRGLCQQAAAHSLRAELRLHARIPYTRVEGGFDGYLKSLSAHRRKRLRHCLNELHRAYRIEFEALQEEDEIREAVEWLVRTKRERMHRKGEWTWFDQPQYPQLLKDFCRAASEKGRLRLFVLRLNDALAACRIALVTGDRAVFYTSAYDSVYEKWSAADAFVLLSIERCLAEGYLTLDFGRGEGAHKAHYARDRYLQVRLDIYRSQPRSLFAEAVAHAAPPLWHLSRALLPKRALTTLTRRLKREAAPEVGTRPRDRNGFPGR